jgi:hypothetical protein
MMFFFVYGEIGLEPLCEFASGEHDTPSAAFAFQPNIRAQTRDGPFVGTARMLFAETQMIVEAEIGKHVGFLSAVSIISLVLETTQFVYGYCRREHTFRSTDHTIPCKRIVINYGR